MRRDTSLTRVLFAITVLGLAAPAAAQTPAPAQGPAKAGVAGNPAQVKRRYHIKVMEGALVGAVRHGADQLGREMQGLNPSLVLFTGVARARGFMLEGYGVFFDVEIPAMRESVAWTVQSLRTLEPDVTVARRMLEQMRRQLQTLPNPQKASLEQQLTLLEAQLAPTLPRVAGERDRMAEPAALVDEAPSTAALRRAQPVADPGVLYTESVKSALVEAMLDYGAPMDLQPDEWLTVAARDGEGPLSPFENYEATTLILRIKGSDLVEFQAKRITREEAQKRVEVREF